MRSNTRSNSLGGIDGGENLCSLPVRTARKLFPTPEPPDCFDFAGSLRCMLSIERTISLFEYLKYSNPQKVENANLTSFLE
jgi:hypothetical protein